MKKINLLLLTALLTILLLSSCEISLFSDQNTKGKVWFIGYGADFGHDHSTTQRNGVDLVFTIDDTIEMGKAFGALAKKACVEYQDTYFIGKYQGELAGQPNVFDSSWATYKAKVKNVLENANDEDIIIFYFSTHGTSDIKDKAKYGDTSSLEENKILFYKSKTENMAYDSVSYKTLYNFIDGFKGTKFILCDTCYSGSFIVGDGVTVDRNSYNNIPASILFDSKVSASSSIWSLTACSADQESSEVLDYEHGGFTYVVLKALGWDGEKIGEINALDGNVLTAGSIANYVYMNGGEFQYHWDLNKFGVGNKQTPVFSAGSSDVILFTF